MLVSCWVSYHENQAISISVKYDDETCTYSYDSEFHALLEQVCDSLGLVSFVFTQGVSDFWAVVWRAVTCSDCGAHVKPDNLVHWNHELLCYTCYDYAIQDRDDSYLGAALLQKLAGFDCRNE